TAQTTRLTQDEMYEAMAKPTFTKLGNLMNTRGVEIMSGAQNVIPGTIDLSELDYVTNGNQTDAEGNMVKVPTGATSPIYVSPGANFDLKLTLYTNAWGGMQFFQYHNAFNNETASYGYYGTYGAHNAAKFWEDASADTDIVVDQENLTITFPFALGEDVVVGDIIVFRAMSANSGASIDADGTYSEGTYLDILFYVVDPEVSVTINPVEGGAVTTSPAEINIGTEVTLTAEPVDGYAFVNWTDANGTEVGTDLTYTFAATKENNYTVNFGKECILTITAPSNGSILVNDESTSGSTILAEGAEVTLTAKPENGYRFSKWVINGSEYTQNPYTTTISDNMSVSAQFEESKQFSISVEQPENGIIEINSETLYEGEQFIITVTPYAGYTLSVLKINGNEQITTQNGSSYQFSETLTSTMSTEIVVTAEIVEKSITYPTMTSWFSDLGSSNRYLAKVTASTASQLVEVFNATTEEELPKNASVSVSESSPSTEGALIDKTATPVLVTKGETSLSMTFITWLYDDMVLNSTTATCQMNWTQQALYIDWNSDGDFTDDGEIYDKSSDNLGSENTSFESVDGYTRIVAIPEGQSVGVYRMRAVYYEPNDASEAWHTTLFTDKSNVIRKGRAYDFELQIVNPAVRVKASPSYAGTVTINGGKEEVAIPSGGSVEVTLSATPNPAYEFVNWTVGGEEVSTEPSFTATVSDPKTYIANFQMPSEYVYEMNENGSKYYRIPALVKASDGSLVAIADKRGDALGDLPNVISIVAKRSTDNGKTW
ncbi:MAG: exo-alpha-sialidase, partial [Coprobacter sp.]|nr:exo-alpha-sialidase [Coprobacter sp.]